MIYQIVNNIIKNFVDCQGFCKKNGAPFEVTPFFNIYKLML